MFHWLFKSTSLLIPVLLGTSLVALYVLGDAPVSTRSTALVGASAETTEIRATPQQQDHREHQGSFRPRRAESPHTPRVESHRTWSSAAQQVSYPSAVRIASSSPAAQRSPAIAAGSVQSVTSAPIVGVAQSSFGKLVATPVLAGIGGSAAGHSNSGSATKPAKTKSLPRFKTVSVASNSTTRDSIESPSFETQSWAVDEGDWELTDSDGDGVPDVYEDETWSLEEWSGYTSETTSTTGSTITSAYSSTWDTSSSVMITGSVINTSSITLINGNGGAEEPVTEDQQSSED